MDEEVLKKVEDALERFASRVSQPGFHRATDEDTTTFFCVDVRRAEDALKSLREYLRGGERAVCQDKAEEPENIAPPQLLICSVCGDATMFCCADCRMDLHVAVPVCAKAKCRAAHEAVCPRELVKARNAAQARTRELEQALNLACSRGCSHCADSIRQARAVALRFRGTPQECGTTCGGGSADTYGAVRAIAERRGAEAMRERAAEWHDEQRRLTSDGFETAIHAASAAAILALPLPDEPVAEPTDADLRALLVKAGEAMDQAMRDSPGWYDICREALASIRRATRQEPRHD